MAHTSVAFVSVIRHILDEPVNVIVITFMEHLDSLWVVADPTTHLWLTVQGEAPACVEFVNVRQERTLRK
jgi:hypothetical protein